jgi:hypothetical protein
MCRPFALGLISELPCCFLAAILYEIQDSSKEAAGKQGKTNILYPAEESLLLNYHMISLDSSK